MNEELNEDARTKQDLLYECSSLECKLSNELIKNEHLEQQCKRQKEIIDKIEEKIKENIKNAKYEITTLTITDRVYYKYIDDMLNELLEILEDKEK